MNMENLEPIEISEEGKLVSQEQLSGSLIEQFLTGTQPFGAQRFTIDDFTRYFEEHASDGEKMALSEYDIKSGMQWLAEQHKIGSDGEGTYWIKESA